MKHNMDGTLAADRWEPEAADHLGSVGAYLIGYKPRSAAPRRLNSFVTVQHRCCIPSQYTTPIPSWEIFARDAGGGRGCRLGRLAQDTTSVIVGSWRTPCVSARTGRSRTAWLSLGRRPDQIETSGRGSLCASFLWGSFPRGLHKSAHVQRKPRCASETMFPWAQMRGRNLDARWSTIEFFSAVTTLYYVPTVLTFPGVKAGPGMVLGVLEVRPRPEIGKLPFALPGRDG